MSLDEDPRFTKWWNSKFDPDETGRGRILAHHGFLAGSAHQGEWVSTLPTKAGHYWLRNYVFKGFEHFAPYRDPIVVRVTGKADNLQLEGGYFRENDLPFGISEIVEGEWSGPIFPHD